MASKASRASPSSAPPSSRRFSTVSSSAWVLWRRSPEGRAPGARFDWRLSDLLSPRAGPSQLLARFLQSPARSSPFSSRKYSISPEKPSTASSLPSSIAFRDDEARLCYEPFSKPSIRNSAKTSASGTRPRRSSNTWSSASIISSAPELVQPLGLAEPERIAALRPLSRWLSKMCFSFGRDLHRCPSQRSRPLVRSSHQRVELHPGRVPGSQKVAQLP